MKLKLQITVEVADKCKDCVYYAYHVSTWSGARYSYCHLPGEPVVELQRLDGRPVPSARCVALRANIHLEAQIKKCEQEIDDLRKGLVSC